MNKKFTFLKVVSVLMMGMLLSFSGFAQVTTSSVTGHVEEPTGESSIGATVVAKHIPSGSVYSGMTNASGRFNLANMRVGGPYHVEVSFVGYKTRVYDDIYLQLGQPYVLNVKFADDNNSLDEIVISSNRNSILNSDRTGAVTSISRNQIGALPSISRSVNDLTRLTPHANGSSIGGGNYRSNNFTIDGANFNNQFGIGQNIPAGGSPISIDAIEQISVNVTPYDVRQSGFTGAAVNAVTRSGRNDFFGSAFYNFRTENQQGKKVEGKEINRIDYNDKHYGLSLGGPIIKDKLFFFVNLEQNKTEEPGTSRVASSPDKPFGSASYIARPSESFLDEVSSFLKTKYNYETGPYQNYLNNSNNDKLFTRIDWNIANNHKVNFRYNQVKSSTINPISSSVGGTTLSFNNSTNRVSNNALHFSNSNYIQEGNLYSGTLEYLGSIGQLNHSLRVSYVNQNEPRSSNSSEFPLVDIKEGNSILTSFGYEPFTFGNLRDVATTTINYDASYVLGKHNLTVGGQFETSITKNGFQRFGAGYYLFDSWNDFTEGKKASYYAITYPLTADGSQAFPSFKFNQTSLYLQDEFTVNNRLRFTGGIRFELPTYPNVTEMKTHPLVAQLSFNGGEKINTGAMPKSQLMISPRFGFNYDVLGDRSLQIRGGSGIFTGRIPFVWIVAQSGDAGMLQATQLYEGTANTPAFSPNIKANIPSTLPAAGTFIPSGGVSSMASDLKFPSTWKSSLAVDYKLPWGIVASVEGIYNKDINAVVARNANLVDPTKVSVEGYPGYLFPSQTTARYINKLTNNINGVPSPTGTTTFNTTVMENKRGGHYWSGMIQLTKQFQKGFSGSLSYVASGAKNYGDGSGDQVFNLWSLPPTNTGHSNIASLGYTSNVLPHRVVGSVTYENYLIKNLKTSVSLFYQGASQGRYSMTYSRDYNRDGQTNDLIYIPRDPSEITFVNIPAGRSEYNNIAYTAEEQSRIFFDLINNDPYLKTRKGQYAKRNEATLPWRNQFDLRISQDILGNIGGSKNSLTVFLDIFNVGNLLKSSWGVRHYTTGNVLNPQNANNLTVDGSVKPTFWLNSNNGELISGKTYRTTETISSTYYMQFGVRVSFN